MEISEEKGGWVTEVPNVSPKPSHPMPPSTANTHPPESPPIARPLSETREERPDRQDEEKKMACEIQKEERGEQTTIGQRMKRGSHYAKNINPECSYVLYGTNRQTGKVYRRNQNKEVAVTPDVIYEEKEWPPNNRREEENRPLHQDGIEWDGELAQLQDDRRLGVGAEEETPDKKQQMEDDEGAKWHHRLANAKLTRCRFLGKTYGEARDDQQVEDSPIACRYVDLPRRLGAVGGDCVQTAYRLGILRAQKARKARM